jgi:hypothetical protein
MKTRSPISLDTPTDPPVLHMPDLPEMKCAWNALLSTNKYYKNYYLRTVYLTGSRSPQNTLWATAPARRLCENN